MVQAKLFHCTVSIVLCHKYIFLVVVYLYLWKSIISISSNCKHLSFWSQTHCPSCCLLSGGKPLWRCCVFMLIINLMRATPPARSQSGSETTSTTCRRFGWEIWFTTCFKCVCCIRVFCGQNVNNEHYCIFCVSDDIISFSLCESSS